MDKLFFCCTEQMEDKLRETEPEMREDSYPGKDSAELSRLSGQAFELIRPVFLYVNRLCMSEQTVASMIRELYRVTVTHEYAYLQEICETDIVDHAFENLNNAHGFPKVLYAVRLLRYYFLVKEKSAENVIEWQRISDYYTYFTEHGIPEVRERKERTPEKQTPPGLLPREQFIPALKKHLDSVYIGQELLKKKICVLVGSWLYFGKRSTLLIMGPSGSGKNYMMETLRSFPELHVPVVTYDCSRLTPSGFTGESVDGIFKKVRAALGKPSSPLQRSSSGKDSCIVFLDEIDKIINFNHDSNGESVNAMVQQQLLSALAGTEVIQGVDTSQILFILGGAFPRIDELKEKDRNPIGFAASEETVPCLTDTLRSQIRKIGGEAEFVGRIGDIVKIGRLSRDELRRILMDERIGAFPEMRRLYQEYGLELSIDPDTVEGILDMAENDPEGVRNVRNRLSEFADSSCIFDMEMNGYHSMRLHRGVLRGERPLFGKEEQKHEAGFRTFS